MFQVEEVERVVETLPVAILMADDQRRILAANQAALKLFGYAKDELLGQTIELLLPERFAVRHPSLYENFVRNPSTRPMGQGRDLAARKSDGQEFPVEVGLTLLPTQPLFYLASIVDITVRKEAEAMLKNRQQDLEEALEATRQQLEEQVAASTRLEERQRLGRELHDTLSQSLYGIGLGLRTAMAKASMGEDNASALQYCLSLTESSLTEMRALLFKLRPKSLEDVPLAAVLENHAQAVGLRTDFEITFQHEQHSSEELDYDRKYALYKITTEALHNCIKHAEDATRVSILLQSEADQVTLVVRDNGPGFKPESTSGHGLRVMQERAEAADGRWRIETGPEGTTIQATIRRGPPLTGVVEDEVSDDD